jgi:hypothetical protein
VVFSAGGDGGRKAPELPAALYPHVVCGSQRCAAATSPSFDPSTHSARDRSGTQLFPEAGEDGRCGVVSSKKFLVSSKEFKLTELLG